jgi:glycosyltransferase involved in cell wall biosynthesis
MSSQEPFPTVTVVTPSYNQGRFIRETIDSVLSQDYPAIEYIVIDGGSTDDTVSILKSYGSRVSWISEPDRGQSEAINKGWKRARGEILAWLNSDDFYMPGAISKAVAYLQSHPDVGLVYGDGLHISEEGRAMGRFPSEPFSKDRLKETCFIPQPATFVRRSVIEQIGFIRESLRYCMDYDLWIRISKRYRLQYVPIPMASVRLHKDCKTVKDRAATYAETVRMLKSNYGYAVPRWSCGYAYRLLDARMDRSHVWSKAVFTACLVGLCAWNLVRFSRAAPIGEFRRWALGLRGR